MSTKDIVKASILAHIDAEIAKDKLTFASNSERCAKVQEEIDERQEEMGRLVNENGALSERIACWTKAKEGVQGHPTTLAQQIPAFLNGVVALQAQGTDAGGSSARDADDGDANLKRKNAADEENTQDNYKRAMTAQADAVNISEPSSRAAFGKAHPWTPVPPAVSGAVCSLIGIKCPPNKPPHMVTFSVPSGELDCGQLLFRAIGMHNENVQSSLEYEITDVQMCAARPAAPDKAIYILKVQNNSGGKRNFYVCVPKACNTGAGEVIMTVAFSQSCFH